MNQSSLHKDDTNHVDQERNQRIIALLPIMEQRYSTLRQLLTLAGEGKNVPDYDLWLAQGDLRTVLQLMTDCPIRLEDDTDYLDA
ncbi:hypothetical protein A1507_22935 [Methylomonas koyamae]|uniref:Uncharacterized protein n=1 Tax=Methylomonas koyamae TaxID=702114 RepID=A0A177NQX1_9GAMM|nr:hypothetical protein [Methylomonas koyamae]OAI20375.1 hypothetical protein A1507_22935 [Methylomonas koyamae]